MSTTNFKIKHLYSDTSGKVPEGDFVFDGMLAINQADGTIYTKNASGGTLHTFDAKTTTFINNLYNSLKGKKFIGIEAIGDDGKTKFLLSHGRKTNSVTANAGVFKVGEDGIITNIPDSSTGKEMSPVWTMPMASNNVAGFITGTQCQYINSIPTLSASVNTNIANIASISSQTETNTSNISSINTYVGTLATAMSSVPGSFVKSGSITNSNGVVTISLTQNTLGSDYNWGATPTSASTQVYSTDYIDTNLLTITSANNKYASISDLDDYYTKQEVDAKQLQAGSGITIDNTTISTSFNIDDYALKSVVNTKLNSATFTSFKTQYEVDKASLSCTIDSVSATVNTKQDVLTAQASISIVKVNNKTFIAINTDSETFKQGVDNRIPTNVSSFTNDSGYLTEHQSLNDYYKKEDVETRLGEVYSSGNTWTEDYIAQQIGTNINEQINTAIQSALSNYVPLETYNALVERVKVLENLITTLDYGSYDKDKE